ncbi:MAG: DNA polymerase I, partial [Clostridia bacterium]|nr:DNA polymerase I [Clostridia bacterium]
MKLLVLDSNSIVNRAFYGIRPLTTKDGVFTNGIYGFLNILLKLKEQVQPDGIVAAFDLRAPTFRHKMYDAYKAGRKGMPDELAMQIPLLKDLLPDLGVTVLEKEGYEADDLLGTLSRMCEKEGYDCVLATGDRDSLQLVNDHTHVLLAATKQGQPVLTEYTPTLIKEEKGITPIRLIDVKALMGDSSDNIPGVAGVGEKTALTLIQTFGTLQGVYDNLQDSTIRPGVRTKLEADKENAFLSYQLGKICCDIPLDLTLSALFEKKDDPIALSQKLASLELFKMIERLNLQSVPVEPVSQSASKSYVYYGETFTLQSDENEKVFVLSLNDKNYVILKNGIYLCDRERVDALFQSGAVIFTHDLKDWYNKGYQIKTPGFDTMLAAYLQNPSASDYSLNRLISEYAISASVEGEIPEQAKEEIHCVACFEGLCEELHERLIQDGQLPLLTQMEMPLAYVLADMEQTGFLVDWEALEQYGERVTAQIEGLVQSIYDLVGYEFNLNSP